ncbi:hypothetical protein K4L06_10370 [Lysobacter sp. BMK333-48F3]|uniref:hypothetical protein n=1 Tax=Lysobacter sp. BMK333-48F3 TaxID=2867962 RepID=UPI001C8C6D92|nr:hypothetical protein [Lysobacter sp. BMK333-48F3]MBX9401716.1 hypothetical protein [Lysobacter sp. BMK333-48F3]
MRRTLTARLRLPAALALCLAAGACANFSAVEKYSDQTKKLSAAFAPMMAGSVQSCVDHYTRRKLITSTSFDPAQVQTAAQAHCKGAVEANEPIAALNDLLAQYADTLAALSDKKLPSYSEDFGALKGSLAKLTDDDGTTPTFEKAELDSVIALADFLARIGTQYKQRKHIRELLGHEAAVFTIVDTLKSYATLNYKGYLDDELGTMKPLQLSLERAAKTEPLAANAAKSTLLTETRQIEARRASIDQFVKAADQLKVSHAKLREKIDRLDDAELAKQLNDYAKEVNALRKQLRDAF